VGEFGSSEGCREERTNSGESILDRWVRKRGFHNATPMLAGVLEEWDIVRAMCKRRLLAREAMVTEGVN
jgi:hypothetical protein